MGDVAKAAGVSIKTVEAIFGTKSKPLSDLRDVSIAGNDEAIPLAEHTPYREMLEEPDPRRQLERFARISCSVKRRTAALNEVIRRAAQSDEEIRELWRVFQVQYMTDQRVVAERLDTRGMLREELDAAGAAEIIGMLNHPSVYYLAVFERGWSEEQFERWLADAMIRQLLR